MRQKFFPMAAILLLILQCGTAVEWYEQGHQSLLTWQNFDSSIQEKGSYKFVKFFTRNCRYCRLLKQVEEELQKEKDWGFKFYSVDCSLHNDLCSTKASISAYPYVGIYSSNGTLTGKIGGFYPLETMREAFKTIEEWQNAELGEKSTEPQMAHEKQPEVKTVTVQNQEKNPEVKVEEVQTKIEEKPKQTKTNDEDNNDWTSSIKDGVRMTIMLVGVIIFNKTISPYLQKEKQPEDICKPRVIELPLHPSQSTSAKNNEVNDTETIRLLSDTL